MAPKKKEQQKMSLGTFLQDERSWADEMEDMPVYSRTGYGTEKRVNSTATGNFGGTGTGGYSIREEIPIPDKPPFTVHLGNLSFDATIEHVKEFFTSCDCTSVRIIEDKVDMKPKGFGYAEFATREGIIKALGLGGSQFQGRNIRISVADPPKDRDRPDARELGDWSRKGPLPDLPNRTVDRRASDKGFSGRTFGDTGSELSERKDRRDNFLQDDGKIRDLGNWERRGPLSPLPQPDRQAGFRDGGRPRTNDGSRVDGLRDRKSSPAWTDGRLQGPQDGSRPPRREFQERPVAERPPTAAEQDNQWRAKMRPDPPAKPRAPSRDGTENLSSLAPPAPASRPKLNLAKRTVSETVDHVSPTPISGDVKSSPFGGARPIDTATKEKEIEEKRLTAAREKREAEEKEKRAREKRLAKEAAKAEKSLAVTDTENENDGTNPDGSRKVEILQRHERDESKEIEAHDKEDQNGTIADEKIVKSKDVVRDVKPRSAETGGWRRHNGGPKSQRGNNPPRNQQGDVPPKASRNDNARIPRANGDNPVSQVQGPHAVQETANTEEDGWSTVSKPKKNQRGNQAARNLPS